MCAPAPNYFVPYRTIHNYSTRYFGRPQCTKLYNTQNLRSQGPKAPSVNSTKTVLLYAIMLVFQCQIKGSGRDKLGNTSPSDLEISLGRGFCIPWALVLTSSLDSGNLRPQEISRSSGDVFPSTSLLFAVYGYKMWSRCAILKEPTLMTN